MKTKINIAGVLLGFINITKKHRYNFNTPNRVSRGVIETQKRQFFHFFYPLLISIFILYGCIFPASILAEELPLSVSPTIAAPGQTVTVNGVGFQNGARALVWGGENFVTGSVDTPVPGRDIVINGHYAYVTTWESDPQVIDKKGGLQVIDISSPQSPFIVSSVETSSNNTLGIAISGDYAYMVSSDSGLKVIDISSPQSPFIVGSVDTSDNPRYVAIDGSYAYVTELTGGVKVIDISNPQSPFIVGNVDTSSRLMDIAISDHYAYVTNLDTGLIVLDITSPQSPFTVGSADIPILNHSVAIAGNYAYIGTGYSGGNFFKVIDISRPQSPLIVGSVDAPRPPASGVAISGQYAYVTNYTNGLKVIDISSPQSPFIVGSVYTYDSVLAVDISGHYAYVVGTSGLSIIPSAISSNTVFKNSTTLEIVLPTHLPAGTYDVTVLNPDGTIYKAHNEITIRESIIEKPKPIIKTNDSAKIEIGLDSGSVEGTNSDWWLVAKTPSELFSYDLGSSSWVSGINVTYQNVLFSFDSIDLLNISDLPQGTNTVYFGVDLLMNGELDQEQLHYDSVEVTVSNSSRSGTVYILLHGYNSSVNGAWTDLVTDNAFEARLGDCENNNPLTTNDVYITDSEDLANLKAKNCYAYEYANRDIWENGDGSTYSELETELKNLVDAIDNVRKPENIMFITHSKGGLNLRAYLQGLSAPKPFKIGMLTIDTPHQGTPLGRVHSWLVNNNYSPSDIPTQETCHFSVPDQLLRTAVMSPATSYLAQSFEDNRPVNGDDAVSEVLRKEINNDKVGRLGDYVDNFGQITSAGIFLGDNYKFGFDFFPHTNEEWGAGEAQAVNCLVEGKVYLAERLRNYVFENLTDFYQQGHSEYAYSVINTDDWIYGDGLVPETSQRLDLVPDFTRNDKPLYWIRLHEVEHTKANGRTAEIESMLDMMEANWR